MLSVVITRTIMKICTVLRDGNALSSNRLCKKCMI